MAYFRDEEARAIIRETYGQVSSDGTAVAAAFYAPEELETLPLAAVAPEARVIGLDMTPEMVERARRHAAEAGLANVDVRQALIEEIPLPDACVDVVISNGVLNLSTRKSRVLAETLRVLRPGGRVSIADLVLDEALPEDVLKSPAALAG